MICIIVAVIYLVITIITLSGLITPFLLLMTFVPDGTKYGPLGITNPPLIALLMWGSISLLLIFTTIKLFQKRKIGFYFAILFASIFLLLSFLSSAISLTIVFWPIILILLLFSRNEYL